MYILCASSFPCLPAMCPRYQEIYANYQIYARIVILQGHMPDKHAHSLLRYYKIYGNYQIKYHSCYLPRSPAPNVRWKIYLSIGNQVSAPVHSTSALQSAQYSIHTGSTCGNFGKLFIGLQFSKNEDSNLCGNRIY